MNPKPSLFQCLVLHEIADGDVWHQAGRWRSTYLRNDVTQQVEKLHTLGLIRVTDTGSLSISPQGHDVLKRRPVMELLEQIDRLEQRRAAKV